MVCPSLYVGAPLAAPALFRLVRTDQVPLVALSKTSASGGMRQKKSGRSKRRPYEEICPPPKGLGVVGLPQDK